MPALPTQALAFGQTGLHKTKNLCQSEVAADYAVGATTVSIVSASALTTWPTANFVVLNATRNELMFVTSRAGTDLTIGSRAFGGTTAAAGQADDEILVVEAAEFQQVVADELVKIGELFTGADALEHGLLMNVPTGEVGLTMDLANVHDSDVYFRFNKNGSTALEFERMDATRHYFTSSTPHVGVNATSGGSRLSAFDWAHNGTMQWRAGTDLVSTNTQDWYIRDTTAQRIRLGYGNGDLDILTGSLRFGGIEFVNSGRRFAGDVTPENDGVRVSGTANRRWAEVHSVQFIVEAAGGAANPVSKLSTNGLELGPGGATPLDLRLYRHTADRFRMGVNQGLHLFADSSLAGKTAGQIERLITLQATTTYDRPWLVWLDDAGTARAAFGWHYRDGGPAGSIHNRLEAKSTATDGVTMLTRWRIGADDDYVDMGVHSLRTFEVDHGAYEGDAAFGFDARMKDPVTPTLSRRLGVIKWRYDTANTRTIFDIGPQAFDYDPGTDAAGTQPVLTRIGRDLKTSGTVTYTWYKGDGTNGSVSNLAYNNSASTGTWDFGDATFNIRVSLNSAAILWGDRTGAYDFRLSRANNSLVLQSETAVTNGALVDSPAFTLRAKYDSDAGAGTTSANFDSSITHNITTGGASPLSQIDLKINGATLASLQSIGRLDLPITGIDGGVRFGGDTHLYQDGANMLALASGDSFRIVSGSLYFDGVELINSAARFTAAILPNADMGGVIGSESLRFNEIHAIDFKVEAGVGEANPVSMLGISGLELGAGGGTGLSWVLGFSAPDEAALGDGDSIATGTVTGSMWGTATNQKMGWWGAAPVVRHATAFTQTYATADATHAARTAAALTDNTGGAASTTLAAITAGTLYSQADMTAVKNAIASLAAQVNALRNDQLDTAQFSNYLVDVLQSYGFIG